MNDQIFEVVITTVSASGEPHIAPMGIRYKPGGQVLLLPFKPSRTLDNVLATGAAVLNRVVDTRIIAGSVTGRRRWPLLPADRIFGHRLQAALSHLELRLLDQQDDPQRPVLTMETVHEQSHSAFAGFNRAQSAVIEGAVLVSRLHMLPLEKIEAEMRYLQTAVDKTAGPEEHEAWGWLQDAVELHRRKSSP
ncbi:DUF447 domain-containing protein [Pelomonas sp. KK5]|uniref:DUF447 domain-containing protein n=1 Tax=Pelomonas sp. KK5 TaxID=1855730 RepID=UPI00097BF288|nr:DUF447 domain-containing protein [Pelomonas sp. KK5]